MASCCAHFLRHKKEYCDFFFKMFQFGTDMEMVRDDLKIEDFGIVCFSKSTNDFVNCLNRQEFLAVWGKGFFAWPRMTTSLPHTSPISEWGHCTPPPPGRRRADRYASATHPLFPDGGAKTIGWQVEYPGELCYAPEPWVSSPQLHSPVPSRFLSHRAPVQGLWAIAHCLSISAVPRGRALGLWCQGKHCLESAAAANAFCINENCCQKCYVGCNYLGARNPVNKQITLDINLYVLNEGLQIG